MKKTTTNIFKVAFLALFTTAIISSCSDDNDPVGPITGINTTAGAAYAENVNNIASNVIVLTYEDLAAKGEAVLAAAKALKAGKTAANLTKAKEAWQEARAPWEKSEGFLYGPVDTYGIDPAIDSWPVNVTDMNNLLQGSVEITVDVIDEKLGNTAKGFHLIEWLLWGTDGNKAVADFTDRELVYLVAASENLKDKTAILYDSWKASGDNYVNNFLTAGQTGNKKYTSTKAAILDVVSGMITIADEVGNAKIEDPFNGNNGAGDVTAEESRFSHNSKLDFANNIRSIENVYKGKYGSKGNSKGIKQIIASVDSALATKIETEITAAITAIEGITGTFTSAITNDRPGIEKAQKAVQALQASLEAAKVKINNDLK